jgi:methionyl-tRNA formyltransferase
MILSKETPIYEIENARELHDRLLKIGSEAVVETLALIGGGNVTTTIQKDSSSIKTAYKLNRENCKIDWNVSGKQILNLILGLSPYPAAWCLFKDGNEEWSVKIYEAKLSLENHSFAIGTIIFTKKELKIAVQDGFIEVLSLQFPGKKQMKIADLLNGITFLNTIKAL